MGTDCAVEWGWAGTRRCWYFGRDRCVQSRDAGHPVLILLPMHHLLSLLALTVCGEGAEGRGGHWLAAQPHVVRLLGQARVNIQPDFCFVGTCGTWQHRQCSWSWGFTGARDGPSGRECSGLCLGKTLTLLLQPNPGLFLNVLAGTRNRRPLIPTYSPLSKSLWRVG